MNSKDFRLRLLQIISEKHRIFIEQSSFCPDDFLPESYYIYSKRKPNQMKREYTYWTTAATMIHYYFKEQIKYIGNELFYDEYKNIHSTIQKWFIYDKTEMLWKKYEHDILFHVKKDFLDIITNCIIEIKKQIQTEKKTKFNLFLFKIISALQSLWSKLGNSSKFTNQINQDLQTLCYDSSFGPFFNFPFDGDTGFFKIFFFLFYFFFSQ